ncbi:MAG: ATP-binding cassette domain-containing protein [Quinella sp. 1Q7]|nr:ATP-binding cassette domain-containing protein [Quinella sp. 1Q7]
MIRKKFLPAIVAHVSAALSELLLMASAAWLIASAALHPPISALSVGITLVRTAGISRAALRYADRFISHKIIFKLLDELREELFLRAARILPLKSGRAHEGELLHALTVQADVLKDFLPRVVLPLTTAALVTGLLTYFLLEPLKIFALILPTILLADVIIAALTTTAPADDSTYREKILDFGDGRDELKIFGTAPAIKALDIAATDFGKRSLKLTARLINFDATIRILNAAGFFFVLLKVGVLVDTIALTVWSFILLATLELFAQIPAAVRTWKDIRGAELVDEKISPAQILPTDKAVELQGVTFGYAGEKIFRDLSLTIERGERVALVGESGAGKTTLLYLLTKLFTPDAGTVALGGSVAASTFGNVIFSASIRENFRMLHPDITDEKISDALKLCGLDGFDINAPLGEDGARLSGGERNRLQVALAAAQDSDILICDEPTAGLDRSRADKLIANLVAASHKKNRTLIIITHDSNYFSELGSVELTAQKF